ncbi:MAG: Holliday junction branch migration protein RuvA, partial [Erysipelotrichaceae bacterium]|nr:Holliday junction branch migration protein RuvA [Erysipelotrichaceae bacterium]
VKIYIYLHIREDEMSLFGFSSQEEKNLFMKLISVKGLGPKTAMGILGATTLDSLFNAIEQGDVAFMKKMPGIGAKTASQIVLDLQGKLVPVEKKEAGLSSELSDALEALKALGYKPAEVAKIRSKLSETPGLSTDEYLKMGLAMMMKL